MSGLTLGAALPRLISPALANHSDGTSLGGRRLLTRLGRHFAICGFFQFGYVTGLADGATGKALLAAALLVAAFPTMWPFEAAFIGLLAARALAGC